MSAESPRRKYRFFSRTLAECVEPLTKPVFREHGMAQAKIIRHWESIVGPELAAHATPHRLTQRSDGGGTLVIHTFGGFALELQHMEPVILERLATWLGYRAAVRLKIEQVARIKNPAPAQRNAQNEQMRQALHQLAQSLQNEPG